VAVKQVETGPKHSKKGKGKRKNNKAKKSSEQTDGDNSAEEITLTRNHKKTGKRDDSNGEQSAETRLEHQNKNIKCGEDQIDFTEPEISVSHSQKNPVQEAESNRAPKEDNSSNSLSKKEKVRLRETKLIKTACEDQR
jgi:FtsZ-interacting cell division protein ZipA